MDFCICMIFLSLPCVLCIYRDYCVYHYKSTELVSLYTVLLTAKHMSLDEVAPLLMADFIIKNDTF